jgi:hypothetical protein
MATADYWSSADLKAIVDGGLIREDVMNEIWDISNVPLPFTDMISSDTCDNSYTEWTTDELSAPNLNNAVVDGADAVGNDAKGGARVGNRCQISVKEVAVTQRANASDTIGRAQELGYQIMERQKELRRDREAIYLSQQGSQTDNGDAIPGLLGGLGAWIETNTNRGLGGAVGGFSSGQVLAPTVGTVRALSFATVQSMASDIWVGGGNPTVLMSVPQVIRSLSRFMFTDTAQIATLTSETTQSKEQAVAKGAVNVLVTDFGVTLEMIPNRIQQVVDAAPGLENANVYLIDPAHARESFLDGYRVETLAKTGLADKREMSVDGTLKVLNEKAFGSIADIDYNAPVVA